ncbi:glycosyltransferase, partial [bacterium]|nr:glycosyltransferase [bacterium]
MNWTFGKPELPGCFDEKCASLKADLHLLKYKPKITLACDPNAYEALLQDLRAQTYPHWELHPAAAQEALQETQGEWFGWLPQGIRLSPVALQQLVRVLQNEAPDLLYTHTLQTGADPKLVYRGALDAFTLRQGAGPGPFWLARRQAIEASGGFRADDGEAFIHALMVRLSERGSLRLVPQFLASQDSASVENLSVSAVGAPPALRANRRGVVAVPFRDRGELTARAIRSLAKQKTSVVWELLLIDNGSQAAEREKAEQAARELGWAWKLVSYPHAFNYAAMHNAAFEQAVETDFLFLLNNDVVLHSTGALETMAAWGAQPWVGTVGIQLQFPDGKLQHAGISVSQDRITRRPAFTQTAVPEQGADRSRQVLANTFAAVLFRREVWDRVGGMRAFDYPNAHSDTAFCLSAKRLGLANLYLGNLVGRHLQSASRGSRYEGWEFEQLCTEFAAELRQAEVADWRTERLTTEQSLKQGLLRRVSKAVHFLASRFPSFEKLARRSPRWKAVL